MKSKIPFFALLVISIFFSISLASLNIESCQENFTHQLSCNNLTSQKIDKNYTMIIGKRKFIQNFTNETVLSFKDKNNKAMQSIVRPCKGGVVIMYLLPVVKEAHQLPK